MIKRQVQIIIYTRPIEEQKEHMRKQATLAVEQLRNIGVCIRFVTNTHRKVALIDDHICWAGSTKILSWNKTLQQMRRSEGIESAKELIQKLGLNNTAQEK